MWKRFADKLRCPICREPLVLEPFSQEDADLDGRFARRGERLGLSPEALGKRVESGVLLCESCRSWFPVFRNLPVLLPYAAATHDEFLDEYASEMKKFRGEYSPPEEKPAPGEKFVLKSFSREWLDYEYDDVLWTWTYEERERIFLRETGLDLKDEEEAPRNFIEIGCGLGVVTSFAQRRLRGDAVGVDLSLAGMRAAGHFRDNPFLHFVQASLWRLPFAEKSFDVVYSHGVLHHTRSTEEAFYDIARLCAPGGLAYVWLYGPGSINDNPARRLAYFCEAAARPVLARLPAPLAWPVLAPVALLYMIINRLQRAAGERRQSYNFSRAIHAVRDRLTPLFAWRTGYDEAERWFRKAGFDGLEKISLDGMPPGMRDTFRRNVGLRGKKK